MERGGMMVGGDGSGGGNTKGGKNAKEGRRGAKKEIWKGEWGGGRGS